MLYHEDIQAALEEADTGRNRGFPPPAWIYQPREGATVELGNCHPSQYPDCNLRREPKPESPSVKQLC